MPDGSTNTEPEAAPELPADPSLKVKLRPKPGKLKLSSKAPKLALSSIGFPYLDMENGISVARAMLDAGGVALTRDQLAGAMKLVAGSGTFILKVGTARQFGLVENKDGKYQLTQLGSSIIDSDDKREKSARAEAFLTVPLYKRVYDEFRGKQLPPRPHGLEQAFRRFGVTPKQLAKARHAFERSARQAGFFANGDDRLVEPIVGGPTTHFASAELGGRAGLSARASSPSDIAAPMAPRHPFIEGLLATLAAPKAKWPLEDRKKWLTAAANIFDLIYRADDETEQPPEAS